jgi:hypothetical protein
VRLRRVRLQRQRERLWGDGDVEQRQRREAGAVALRARRRQNVAVEIYNPSKDVLEVLEITGLTKIMPVSYTDGDGSPTA